MSSIPKIIRFEVKEKSVLSKQVSEVLGVSLARAKELIDLGAVYVARKGSSNEKEVRITSDDFIPILSSVRVHHTPMRYPQCYNQDWQNRLVFIDEDYVAVDKPWGIVTMPHVSNNKEVLHKCVASALSLDPLIPLNRIDEFTSGVIISARHRSAAIHFQKLLSTNKVHKSYRTLSQGVPPPLGELNHFINPAPAFGLPAPRLISNHMQENWKLCKLVVEQKRSLHLRHLNSNPFYECSVNLITGRTHQIRAQFAAIGSPLMFDTQYQAMSGVLVENFPSNDASTQEKLYELMKKCFKPITGIGLYCSEVAFDGKTVTGNGPWWENSYIPNVQQK